MITNWLASITCKNLRSSSLESYGLEVVLDSSSFTNLQHFDFLDYSTSSHSTVIALIQSKPPLLKSFQYHELQYNSIFENVSMHLPNIECLGIAPHDTNLSSPFPSANLNRFQNLKCIGFGGYFENYYNFNGIIDALKANLNLEIVRVI